MPNIDIPVDETLSADAQSVLSLEGLTVPEAVAMFLKTVVYEQSLPAVFREPNDETLEAMQEADAGVLKKYGDVKSFMRSLHEDD